MARKLSLREKTVIMGGAVFLVLFLLYFFLVSPQLKRISSLKDRIDKLQKTYQNALTIVDEYELLVAERDQLKKKLLDQDPNFNLSLEVSKIETMLDFKNNSLRPGTKPQLFDVYSRSWADVKYQDKSLDEIVNYLYELEKPEHGIIVEKFRLEPLVKNRENFNFNINLYSVSLMQTQPKEGG